MKEPSIRLLHSLHQTLSKPATAYLGRMKLPLRGYHVVGAAILITVIFAIWSRYHSQPLWSGTQGEFVSSDPDELHGSLSKGTRIDVADFTTIARWDSFVDEESGEYITTPLLMHDPATGYVCLVYNAERGEATFKAYYSSKGDAVRFPVRWSDREVRAFSLILNDGL